VGRLTCSFSKEVADMSGTFLFSWARALHMVRALLEAVTAEVVCVGGGGIRVNFCEGKW
jgi:hypothetical protein